MKWALLLLALAGCSSSSPTSPSAPTFIFSGATAAEEADVLQLWPKVAACTHTRPDIVHDFLIVVVQGAFYCNGVLAAGCTWDDHSMVARSYTDPTGHVWQTFHPAMGHELVNMALMQAGRLNGPDDYRGTLFAACDADLNPSLRLLPALAG